MTTIFNGKVTLPEPTGNPAEDGPAMVKVIADCFTHARNQRLYLSALADTSFLMALIASGTERGTFVAFLLETMVESVKDAFQDSAPTLNKEPI